MKPLKPCLELTGEQRDMLKANQLEILDCFCEFCRRNNLRFYLFGGTLLGAIRHHGYIPWDDDIDVCMPREDYDRFINAWSDTSNYYLETAMTDKKYFYHFAKLMKANTKYDEYYVQKLNCRKGIFIDIFPINGYPCPRSLSYYWYNFWLFLFNKRSFPRGLCQIRKRQRNLSYILMTCLSYVLLWWLPFNMCARLKNWFMRRHQFPKSDYCIVGTNLRKVYRKSYFTGLSYVDFEGRQMPAMENPAKYLQMMYGNYMELPPADERIPHHYVVDLK